MQTRQQVTAGIVIFHPDEDHLARLVAAVAPDVREVLVYANSPLEPGTEERLRSASGATTLSVLRPLANEGLGAAYNDLLRHAHARRDTFLFLLDQDSLPEPGTVPRLAVIHRDLAAAGERPAIVGPHPTRADGTAMSIAGRSGDDRSAPAAARVEFAISSGSLLRCEAALAVGPFRADFFIDAIDVEWCMRANDRGFSTWVAKEVRMVHELGQGVIRLPMGIRPTDQPPRRLYTFLRNQLVMLRLRHVPWRHKAKTLLLLPMRIVVYLARHRFSRESRTAIWKGLADGARQRLGSPDRVFRGPVR